MAANIAKVFIIMTLVFEVITITCGSTLYPLFAVASVGFILGMLLQYIITKSAKRASNAVNNHKFAPHF